MIDGLHAAYGGLIASGKRVSDAAHDIARVQGGEKRKSPAAEPDRGLETTNRADRPNPADLGFEPVEAVLPPQNSDIDLAKALIDLTVGQRSFEANAASLATQEETLGTLLDILA